METSAIIAMIIILGCVWGGFIYALRMAIRKEREKSNGS